MTGSSEHAAAVWARCRELIRQQRLPADYEDLVQRVHLPLADHLAARRRHAAAPLIVGLCGSQGSGKSTMALFLQALLHTRHALATAVVSLDDLYLTRAERETLARDVHPLLRTRGVPGTHDVALGVELLRALCRAGENDATPIPGFDKAADDRAAPDRWTVHGGAADVVLLEGWCVGAHPQDDTALSAPINALEREHDTDGSWRRYVNRQLATGYRALFEPVDCLVLLKAPDFECVFEWRARQEARLRETLRDAANNGKAAPGVMNDEQLRTFIMHYERLTRHILATMPAYADAVAELGRDQDIVSLRLG